jgi:hypothetical protein
MADDFTEDFEDDPLPEEFQEEAPKQAPPRRPAPAPPQRGRPAPLQRQQVQAPASAPVQTQKVRYVPFELPARIGIFDNSTGQPLMEESPKDKDKLDMVIAKLDVIFGAVTELMNKVTELEKDI